jgi:hypothetical protein
MFRYILYERPDPASRRSKYNRVRENP